jgi:hypothetical protein
MWSKIALSILTISLACTIFLSGCINTAGPIQNGQATQPQAEAPDSSQKDVKYGSYVLHLYVEGNSIKCCDDKAREEDAAGSQSNYAAEIFDCLNKPYTVDTYKLPLENCTDNQSCPNEAAVFCLVIPYKEYGQEITIHDKDKPEIRTDKPINISKYAAIKCTKVSGIPDWVLYVLLALLVIIICLAAFFVTRKLRARRRISMPPPPPPPPAIPKARLVTPGDVDIPIAAGTMSIGRGDLARAVAAEDLKYISKQHFTIDFSEDQYYIEDINSINGTKLNGVEIKGRGKQALKDGDQITIADVVTITFRAR